MLSPWGIFHTYEAIRGIGGGSPGISSLEGNIIN